MLQACSRGSSSKPTCARANQQDVRVEAMSILSLNSETVGIEARWSSKPGCMRAAIHPRCSQSTPFACAANALRHSLNPTPLLHCPCAACHPAVPAVHAAGTAGPALPVRPPWAKAARLRFAPLLLGAPVLQPPVRAAAGRGERRRQRV